MTRTRRNLWKGDRAGHRTAAHIGWAFRPRRAKGPAKPGAYLRAAGVTPRALARYRRKHPVSGRRRVGRSRRFRRALGFRVNAGRRRVGSYAGFVKRFASRSRLRGPALFRAAARAYRGNADPFPMLNARRRVRRNQLPGLVYYNARRKKARRGRKGRGRARRNAVLPYLAWDDNARRKGRKRGRRGRVGSNAVLPYAAFNSSADDNPMEALGEAVETTFSTEFWSETVLPMGAGYIGGQFAGGLVYGLVQKLGGSAVAGSGILPSVARVGSKALGSAAVSAAAFFITKDRDVAGKVLAGGLVAVLASIVQEIVGIEAYKSITGMAEIGDMAAELTDELKARIAESVRGEIARAEGAAGYQAGVNAFVTAESLQPAPYMGPGPRVGEMGVYPSYAQVYGQPGEMSSFVTTQELRTAPVAAGSSGVGDGMVADLSMFSDSFADASLV